MYIINSDADLKEILKREKKVYIYGEGKIAKAVFGALSYEDISKIEGVIVSCKNSKLRESRLLKEVSDVSLRRDMLVFNLTGKLYKLDIENNLLKEGFEKSIMLSDEYEEELNRRLQKNPIILSIDVVQYVERINPREKLEALVVNICDHCNLNCRGCDHFSSIAEKRFNSVEEIQADLIQIHNILDENINVIGLMGGEPLLHPELNSILEISRKIFPNVPIWLCSNGIGLLNQTEEFWRCCRENDIEINVTKYPVSFDYDKAQKMAESQGVKYMYYHGGLVEKTLGHYPLDLEGKQDAEKSFMGCFHANNTCNMLNHGRLYTCTVAPCIPIFNKKYGLDIPLTEEDGIDIYKVSDKKTLFEMLSRPMPVCKYCEVKKRTFGHPWGQSGGNIEEWT